MYDPKEIENQLAHFGIPGMKWGVRRNSTSSGNDSRGNNKKAKKVDEKTKPLNSNKLKKKKIKDMTDDELKTHLARLQLEKQVKDLSQPQINAGKKLSQEVLVQVGKNVATAYGEQAAKVALNAAFSVIAKRSGVNLSALEIKP